MQGIAMMFSDGGPFMFLILLMGIALFALTIVGLVRAGRSDMTPLLWGLLFALLFLGALGTVMGLQQGFYALQSAAPDVRAALMAQAIAIAINTTTLSLVFAFPLSIMIGIASFRAKGALRRELDKG